MRMIFRHSYTMLRFLVFWRRGVGIAALILFLLVHLNFVLLLDARLFWSGNKQDLWLPHGPGLFQMGVVLVAALIGVAQRGLPADDTSKWLPHPALPLTVPGRAIGDILALTVAWLVGGLAMLGVLAFIEKSVDAGWGPLAMVHFWRDSARFGASYSLWLPLLTVVALHVHEGQRGTAVLMGSFIVAVEMLTDTLGFLDTSLGMVAVSTALLTAVVLLGSRPRPRPTEVVDPGALWDHSRADDRGAAFPVLAEPGGHGDTLLESSPPSEVAFRFGNGRRSRKGPFKPGRVLMPVPKGSIYRPAMDPVTQLRHDTWEVTALFMKVVSAAAVLTCPLVLALSLFELWGDWSGTLVAPTAWVFLFMAGRVTDAGGIPMGTSGANARGDLGTDFFRACAMLPLPPHAMGRAMLRQVVTLAGYVAAVLLASAGISALAGGDVAAVAMLGLAPAALILAPGICGAIIASSMGNLKDGLIVGLSLLGSAIAMLIMVVDLSLDLGGLLTYVLLAAPLSVFGGLLPVRRFLMAPSPEVTHGRV